jgi:hypothetical protein
VKGGEKNMTTIQLVDEYLRLYVQNKAYERKMQELRIKLMPKIKDEGIEHSGFILSKSKRWVFKDVTIETARKYHAVKEAIDTQKLGQVALLKLGKIPGIAITECLNIKTIPA